MSQLGSQGSQTAWQALALCPWLGVLALMHFSFAIAGSGFLTTLPLSAVFLISSLTGTKEASAKCANWTAVGCVVAVGDAGASSFP